MKKPPAIAEAGESLASPLLIEIGISILALAVLVYFLTGFFLTGEGFSIAIVLAAAGTLLTLGGFAIGRRGSD